MLCWMSEHSAVAMKCRHKGHRYRIVPMHSMWQPQKPIIFHCSSFSEDHCCCWYCEMALILYEYMPFNDRDLHHIAHGVNPMKDKWVYTLLIKQRADEVIDAVSNDLLLSQ